MQYIIFTLLTTIYSFIFLQNKKKFMHVVLIVSGFPLSLFMPSLIIGGISAQGAYLLILFVLLLIISLSKLHIFVEVVSRYYLTSGLVLLSFVSLMWTQSIGEGISMTVKYATCIVFITTLLSVTKSYKDILLFEKSIIICGIVLVILSVLNKITGGYFDSVGGRLIWANTFVLLAPYMGLANYSFMVGMCALLSLANYVFGRNKKAWLSLIRVQVREKLLLHWEWCSGRSDMAIRLRSSNLSKVRGNLPRKPF